MKKILLSIIFLTAASSFSYSVAIKGGEGTNVTKAIEASKAPPAIPIESFYQQGNDNALTSVIFFPNPVKDILTVRFPRKGSYTVTIYNIIGDQVMEKTVMDESDVKLDLSELQSGMFFLRYEFDGKIVSKRFSKTN